MPVIQLRRLSKIYQGAEGLHPLDLTIPSGEFTAIVGPSGSGKSTLLRLVAGLERPDDGDVFFDDTRVTQLESHARGVGLVVSTGALYGSMDAGENIEFPLVLRQDDDESRAAKVKETASRFSLSRILDRKPRQLSVGQRQLVATGRATVRDTDIVLFDEALGGIDPHKRDYVKNQLRNLHSEGHTVLFATNVQEEAMAMATMLVVLRAGRVEQTGAPLDVYRNPANAFVAEFIGGANLVNAEAAGRDLRIGDDTMELDGALGEREVLVGIRPEDVKLAKPGTPFRRCLHARVTHVEDLGDHATVHVSFGSPGSGALDFVFGHRSRPVPKPGEDVELEVGELLFFDPDTGHRLLPS